MDVEEEGGLLEGERDFYLIAMVKRAYYRLQEFQNEYSVILSELHLTVETDAGFIQLFLDIVIDNPVLDEVLICDFKTSWYPFAAADSKQLALYAYLFKKMRGGVVGNSYKGRLIFPRIKEGGDSEVVFTDELLEEANQWACQTIQGIESRDPGHIEEWKMTEDRKKCEQCPYSALCAASLSNGLPSDGNPKDEAEASKIGDYILLQENTLKRMKEGFKAYAKKTKTPVETQGGKWMFVPGESNPQVPFERVKSFAEDHGLDMGLVFKTEPKVLKQWIEGDESGFLEAHTTWTTPRSNFKYVQNPNLDKNDEKEE